MKTKEYTKEEYLKEIEKEKDYPVQKKWYKHKDKDIYKCELSIFEGDFDVYEEI